MTPQVTIVVSEESDWEGIYVNGTLKHEGHSLCARDVLDALEIRSERVQVVLDPYGAGLPQNLNDLVRNP